MKIKIILWICLICLVKTSNAQYDSIVKAGKKFYYLSRINENNYVRSLIEIKNTKVIYKDKEYIQINRHFDTFLLREDNKKVYIIRFGNPVLHGQEKLIYDFNLQKGDSFNFEVIMEPKDSILKLKYYIDSTYIYDNRLHIKWHVTKNTYLHYENGFWIEGIGNPREWLFYNYYSNNWIAFESGIGLGQICDGKTMIYPKIGECNDSFLSVKKVEKNLKVFPNPAKSNFNIKLPNTEKHHLSIYNNMGKKMEDMILEGKLDYEIGLNYPKGMYVLRIDAALDHYNEVLFIE